MLGVTSDNHFTFTPHIDSILTRTPSIINILKALAGTKCGKQKETILATYKSLTQYLFICATPT